MGRPQSATKERELRIADNLRYVRQTVTAVAQQAGRDPQAVRLIAVSKTVPPAHIDAALRAGQTEFGENTVQDALTKIPQFSGRGVSWHFIGHLQSNKVKFMPDHFSWVHSVDSLPLAQKLSQHCARKGILINALLQVNVSHEATKHGVSAGYLYTLMDEVLSTRLEGIALRGLMTMAPYQANEATLRDCFAGLRQLRDGCIERFGVTDFSELSMGMTDDFPIAIAEGATMVRIGTAIFGPRLDQGAKTRKD